MDRAQRAAETEAIFRDVNETFLEQHEVPSDQTSILCECSNDSCAELILVARAEYERVRSTPTLFFVRPDHVVAGIERVIEVHADYWVIEKIGKAAEIAIETDPRSDN